MFFPRAAHTSARTCTLKEPIAGSESDNDGSTSNPAKTGPRSPEAAGRIYGLVVIAADGAGASRSGECGAFSSSDSTVFKRSTSSDRSMSSGSPRGSCNETRRPRAIPRTSWSSLRSTPEDAPRRSAGLTCLATRALAQTSRGIDTVLVAGGEGAHAASESAPLLAALRRLAPRVRRIGAVCTGAFVLAAAGLLDGRRATTHWENARDLAARYPQVDVEADAIFLKDGAVYTSAGVTAGIDLALALVEEDHGRELALAVARTLVVFARRPGGQTQFSAQLAAQFTSEDAIRALQRWMIDNPQTIISRSTSARAGRG